MAFRFETANERWSWYKRSDTRGAPQGIHAPPTGRDLIREYTQSETKDYWGPGGVGEWMSQQIEEFARSRGVNWNGAGGEALTEIQTALNYPDYPMYQHYLQQFESQVPGIVDFVKQLHAQKGFTTDPEAAQTLQSWHDEFPIRKMMPGENPGDPSPVLDEIAYPKTNYGEPGDDASREDWRDFHQRKDQAAEIEKQRRLDRLRRTRPELLSTDEFNEVMNSDISDFKKEEIAKSNNVDQFLKRIMPELDFFGDIYDEIQQIRDSGWDDVDDETWKRVTDSLVDKTRSLDESFSRWTPNQNQFITHNEEQQSAESFKESTGVFAAVAQIDASSLQELLYDDLEESRGAALKEFLARLIRLQEFLFEVYKETVGDYEDGI